MEYCWFETFRLLYHITFSDTHIHCPVKYIISPRIEQHFSTIFTNSEPLGDFSITIFAAIACEWNAEIRIKVFLLSLLSQRVQPAMYRALNNVFFYYIPIIQVSNFGNLRPIMRNFSFPISISWNMVVGISCLVGCCCCCCGCRWWCSRHHNNWLHRRDVI